MGKHRDWTEIRDDYQLNGLSYEKLAAKYGVSISTLKKAAARQNWTQRKDKQAKLERTKTSRVERAVRAFQSEPVRNGTTETEPTENGTEDEKPSRERFERVVGRLLAKVEASIDIIPPECAKELRSLSGALKDLASLAGWDKDERDREEQQARIAKLRSETRTESAESSAVTVRFVDTYGGEE